MPPVKRCKVPINSLSPKQGQTLSSGGLYKCVLPSFEKSRPFIRSSIQQSGYCPIGRDNFIASRDRHIEIYSVTIGLSRLQKSAGDSQFAVGPGVILTDKFSVDAD